MITGLSGESYCTLRFVLAEHIANVYDDPGGTDPRELRRLAECAEWLGFDIWDRHAIERYCGVRPTRFEHKRLRDLAGMS